MVNVIPALVVLLPDIYQNGSDMLMYPALIKLSSPSAFCDQGIHLELRWNTRSVNPELGLKLKVTSRKLARLALDA